MGKDKTKETLTKCLVVVDSAIASSSGIAEFVGNFVAIGINMLLCKDFSVEKKDEK